MTSLLQQLRTQIRDVRYSLKAITFGIKQEAMVPDGGMALLEITQGHLILTVAGSNPGNIPRLDFDLSLPRYSTVGALYDLLARIPPLAVMLDTDANREHPTLDLETFGPTDINQYPVVLTHRLFSDTELDTILVRACKRHNPSLSPSTLPEPEGVFVLQLAQAEVCRQQALDASKRRGVSMDIGDLRALASDLEKNYADDTTRLHRSLATPKESAPNQTGEGDIVVGSLVRHSLRFGRQAPFSQNLPPAPAVLLEIHPEDAEDELIRVRWERSRDNDFGRYELWMDATPNVMRSARGGRANVDGRQPQVFQGTAPSQTPRQLSYGAQTTSRLVYASQGGSSHAWGLYDAEARDDGVVHHGFVVTRLEPETQYYFRLYTLDTNNEAVASAVVGASTQALRVRFVPLMRQTTMRVLPGDVIVLNFDPTRGAFNANCAFRVGDKQVTPTSFTATSLTFTMPAFLYDGFKAVTVVSPTGLTDTIDQFLLLSNP